MYLGTDFTDDNGLIRVEVKKIYNLEDIIKFEKNSNSTPVKKNLKITTNSITGSSGIKELEILMAMELFCLYL